MGQKYTIVEDPKTKTCYEVSPPGLLRHMSSQKFVHPKCGPEKVEADEKLVVYEGCNADYVHFRLAIVPDMGHWGNIEHINSGMCFHPYGGNGKNGVHLVLHPDRHMGALWTYDEDTHTIKHRSGFYIHPQGGSNNPSNGTRLVLLDTVHDAMRWVPTDVNNVEKPLYHYPDVFGRWEMINCCINPIAEHTLTIKYKVGKENTSSNTEHHAWDVAVGAVAGYIAAGVGIVGHYGGFLEKTQTESFKEKRERELQIKCKPGQSVVTWQWVWGMKQFNDGWDFRTNITMDTESTDVVPSLDQCPEHCREY